MRVLLVAPWGHIKGHPPYETSRVAQSLKKHGVKVKIISYCGLRDEDLSNIEEVKASPWGLIPGKLDFGGKVLASILTTMKGFRESKRGDIIYIMHGFPSVMLPLCKIFRPENLIYKEVSSFRIGIPLAGAWIYRDEGFNYVCESKEVEKDIREVIHPESKITTIPMGVPQKEELTDQEEARKELELPQDKKILLVFGVNHPGKKYETIFKALSKMDEGYFVLFAGKITDEEFNNPYELSEAYDISGGIEIYDEYIPEEELKLYFGAADALVLSYRKTFTAASGVISTACRFQKPVIASRVGSIGNRVEDHGLGLTFEPENPESLREGIRKFFSEENRQHESNIKNFVAEYSWTNIGKKYIDFFEEIASSDT